MWRPTKLEPFSTTEAFGWVAGVGGALFSVGVIGWVIGAQRRAMQAAAAGTGV